MVQQRNMNIGRYFLDAQPVEGQVTPHQTALLMSQGCHKRPRTTNELFRESDIPPAEHTPPLTITAIIDFLATRDITPRPRVIKRPAIMGVNVASSFTLPSSGW